MQTGTALGLLVGGAVLLLATRGPRPAAINPATGQPYPSALNSLNPLNWFGGAGGGAINPAQIFGQQPQQQLPAYMSPAQGGFQNSGYSPYASPGGYSPANFTQAHTGYGSPAYGNNGGYQNAGYSPYASPGGYQSAAWSPGAGYSPYGTGAASPRYSYA